MSAWLRPLRLLGTAASLLLGADLLCIALTPVLSHPRRADVAIVLGNTVRSDGAPSPRLQARLNCALQLYRAGAVRQILVSGGVEPGSPPRDEAQVMARYLESRGVPSSARLLDPHGDDTAATAHNAAQLLGPGQDIIVVSQWFHLCRARLALQQAGFHAVSADCPQFFELRDLYSFAREVVALPVYSLRTPREH